MFINPFHAMHKVSCLKAMALTDFLHLVFQKISKRYLHFKLTPYPSYISTITNVQFLLLICHECLVLTAGS